VLTNNTIINRIFIIIIKREAKKLKKIIGIFIVTLLISAVIPIITATENSNNFNELKIYKPGDVPNSWLEGADQYQTSNCNYGDEIFPPLMAAQEFKPTKEDLTAVALGFFNHDAPSGIEITISIRDALHRSDLTTKTISADDKIKKKGETWVLFDFPDIAVTPETTYYIVCGANGGEELKAYCWFFDINNKYDRGIAWFSNNSGETWFDLEDITPEFPQIDFCFITYYQEPPENKGFTILEQLLVRLIERFPIFKLLLK
jgi:hypothetical protein